MNTMNTMKSRQSGFTLIEVMIVVAIIGILTAIALPSYNAYILRSHRADARNALLAIAQRMEQNYTLSGSYDKTQADAALPSNFIAQTGMDVVPAGGAARYNISFVKGKLTAGTFELQAVPAGAQKADTTCGTLLLNQQGLRGANNALDNRAQLTLDCWGR